MNLYFDGLGYRNPVVDYEQIIWFLQQTVQGKSKSVATRHWLNIKEQYSSPLIKLEAFELLNFIQSKTTAEQEIRRALSRIKTKEKNKKEIDEIMSWSEQRKLKKELIGKIFLN